MIKWRGTAYRIHPLFTIMIILAVFTGYFVELFTLFSIVLIHEIGHLIAAKAFHWRVKEVQLFPFGGVAEVEEATNVSAKEEMIVALAGPLQNCWMIIFALLLQKFEITQDAWWNYFVESNLLIMLFNLVPVLPLDGGKVMQALLSYMISYHKTIVYSSFISLVMSVFVLVISFYHGIQMNWLIIGVFLLYSNWHTYRNIPYLFLRFILSRNERTELWIASGTHAKPIVVYPTMSLSAIVRLFMRENYHLIYVLNKTGEITAVLPEQRIIHSYLNKH